MMKNFFIVLFIVLGCINAWAFSVNPQPYGLYGFLFFFFAGILYKT